MGRSWSCWFGRHSWHSVFDKVQGYGLILRYEICTKCEKVVDA